MFLNSLYKVIFNLVILWNDSLSVLTAIFQVNLDQPLFIEAKDDGSGGK